VDATPLSVELKWRGKAGKVQRTTQQLLPGWHTIQLSDGDVVQTAALR
jgi:hypothetical protein